MITKIKKICDKYFLFIGTSENSTVRVWVFNELDSATRVAQIIEEDSNETESEVKKWKK